MDTLTEEAIRTMQDAGCSKECIARVSGLYACGHVGDASLELRRHRSLLMDELHEQQAKVDAVDVLLRRMKRNS